MGWDPLAKGRGGPSSGDGVGVGLGVQLGLKVVGLSAGIGRVLTETVGLVLELGGDLLQILGGLTNPPDAARQRRRHKRNVAPQRAD